MKLGTYSRSAEIARAGALALAFVGVGTLAFAFAPGARYLLPALPMFAMVAAEWLTSRTRLLYPILGAFAVTMITFLLLFTTTRGIWIEW